MKSPQQKQSERKKKKDYTEHGVYTKTVYS